MNIGILLRNPFQRLVERIHADLAEDGYPDIRPAHGNVFQFIGKKGARITQMAEKAQMTKQSMSYLVEYLEERNYLERRQDPEDGRAVVFYVTKKGLKVEEVAERSIANIQDEWRDKLGSKKYDTLINLLTELNSKM
jgi:DNA-binding MarR family transcriptional regulator